MALNDAFGSGGISVGMPGNSTDALTGSGLFGRFLNNITGKTAENDFNAKEAEKARLFNSAEAEKARDWETMMSNTAYQRAAADMKAAGINPASLGGNGAGSAASSPSAPSASGVAAHSGSGNGSALGTVISAIIGGFGVAAKNAIARSALSTKNGFLDLKHLETNSKIALNAAKQVDMETNSALKKAKDFREHEYQRYKLEGKAMHTDLEEQRFYNTQLKNEILRRHLKKRQG